VLLRNRLLDGFQRDGRVLLSTDDSNLQADYELGGSCRRFRANIRAPAPAWWCAWMPCWCVAPTSDPRQQAL
jgi:ABC-type uncharacterized transport system auxiliary subunit